MKLRTNTKYKHRRSIVGVVAMICALWSSALWADLSQEAGNALFDLPDFAKEVKEASEGGLEYSGFYTDAKKCTAMIEKGKQLGAKDSDVVRGNGGATVKFGDAPTVCENYRRWKVTLDAARYLHNFGLSAPDPAKTKAGELSGTYGQEWSKKGEECVNETKKYVQAGAFSDKVVTGLDFKNHTIKQSLARCETMVSWGKKYAVDTEKAKKDKAAAIRNKYVKAGIKGDRLEHFIHYDSVQWKVAGCRNENGLGNLKKAQLLFQWLENNDGTVGIRRFVFKGDKLLSVTDEKYLTSEKARANCK